MAVTLDKVIPFGRSYAEYRLMFALSPADLAGSILGVGDGPASFNAEATAAGARVVSVDPLYAFGAAEIRARFDAVVDDIIAQVEATPDDWTWSYHRDPADLRRNRVAAIETFAADYALHRGSGRYVTGALPRLPFADGAFDLALSSHLLFLYTAQLDFAFHLAALREMLRVAREARVFPLLDLSRRRSAHLDGAVATLRAEGWAVDVRRVGYELQRGGNEMLVVTRQEDRS